MITPLFHAEGYRRSVPLSQAQPCHCLRITTRILIYDYGPTTVSWCWSPSYDNCWHMHWLRVRAVRLKAWAGWNGIVWWSWSVWSSILCYVGYSPAYWALHGATSLMIFPNANGQIIRNSQLFSLGMDGNNVSVLAGSLAIIHLA